MPPRAACLCWTRIRLVLVLRRRGAFTLEHPACHVPARPARHAGWRQCGDLCSRRWVQMQIGPRSKWVELRICPLADAAADAPRPCAGSHAAPRCAAAGRGQGPLVRSPAACCPPGRACWAACFRGRPLIRLMLWQACPGCSHAHQPHPWPAHPWLPPAGGAVSSAVDELRSFAAQQRRPGGGTPPAVHGIGANVARHADVAALADFARDQLGTVDLWIKWVLHEHRQRLHWGKGAGGQGRERGRAGSTVSWARGTCGSSGCCIPSMIWAALLVWGDMGSSGCHMSIGSSCSASRAGVGGGEGSGGWADGHAAR